MANEEDYLDNLLKSMSDDGKNTNNDIDPEEQLITNQVKEAVEKSNDNNDSFAELFEDGEGISSDDVSSFSGKNIDSLLEEIMNVPDHDPEDYHLFSEDQNQAEVDKNINDELPKEELSGNPDDIARMAMEAEQKLNDESIAEKMAKDEAADQALNEMLDNTDVSEASQAVITPEDTGDDSELSESEIERLVNMDLDGIIEDVTSDSVSIDELFGTESNVDEKSDLNSDNEVHDTSMKDQDSDVSSAEALGLSMQEKEGIPTKKKKGIFSIIKDIFFESLDDEENSETEEGKKKKKKDKDKNKKSQKTGMESSDNDAGNVKEKDENEQLIEDTFQGKDSLDDARAPKKGFFARLKYRLQVFKEKQAAEDIAEQEAEELEAEEKKKNKEAKKAAAIEKKEQAKKEKESKPKKEKPKKAPKPKKEKKPKEPPKPGDILKIKPMSIVLFILFIAGIIVLIQISNISVNYNNKVSVAKGYYENGDYSKAYSKLDGLKLNGNDKTLYRQTRVIMYVQRQYESYSNYIKLNMNTEALDALIKGVDRYYTYKSEAEELGVEDKMTDMYNMIILALRDTFKISETEAISLRDLSDKDFTNYYYKIQAYGEAVK
ncbi:MAG: hypothetical protein Q4F06_05440 [Eubacteriales bacterium]|nr:hypothetical protein [Eubacteriales bacterium]